MISRAARSLPRRHHRRTNPLAIAARNALAAPILTLCLVACGGGGGDSGSSSVEGPPTEAAALVQSDSEASAAVQAAVAGADEVVQQSAGADSFLLPFGGSTVAARERPQVASTLSCTDVVDAPCTGTVSAETDIPQSGLAAAGQHIAVTFNDVSGSSGGQPISLNGSLRMQFLSAFDMNSDTAAGLRVDITITNLSGSSAGVSFGPESGAARLEFSTATSFALTIDGVRLSGLSGVNSVDASNYGIGTATLRRAYWGNAKTYVDDRYSAWNVDAHHVRLNSRATVLAGDTRADIKVISATTLQTVFEVKLTVAGVLKTYEVTATFPDAGGTPTYSVTAV